MREYSRFSVYKHTLVYGSDKLLRRNLIVVKDSKGNITGWTDWHKYAVNSKKQRIRSIYSDGDKRCFYIVSLLNYVFFDRYCINRLIDIEAYMVKDFLNDYSLCRLSTDDENTHRAQSTVNHCVSVIIDFLDLLIRDNPKCKMRIDELYRDEKVFDKRKKRYITRRVPAFDVRYIPYNRHIFRDIPDAAFQLIMTEIVENHTRILMLAALGAFAGMRPSECCNVRRTDSALGPGIRFNMVDGEVTDVFIDLTEEKNLRSDFVSVGGIKKERVQRVYPNFIEVFVDCYNVYMKYIEGEPYESEYGALTNTSFGKAYTYFSYRNEFQKVVEACVPKMLESDDPVIVNYGHLLLEHNISPHIFRHWFSVRLTLYGEDVAGLKFWRGDKSPESALVYLMNKSDLEKQYEKVSDEVFNYNLWRASKVVQADD